MEAIPTKAESRYSTTADGEPYVMTRGEQMMRSLFVDNWDSHMVMHRLEMVPHLGRVQELHGLTTYHVLVWRTGWMNVFIMDGEVMIVHMLKMQA